MLTINLSRYLLIIFNLLNKPTLRFSDEFHDKDIYNLGLHLVDVHGELDKNSFNRNYAAIILLNSSPNNLAVEHLMIHRLKCIKSFGLNSDDPFGIPLLNVCKYIF